MNAFTRFNEGTIYEPIITLDGKAKPIVPVKGLEIVKIIHACGCGGCAYVIHNKGAVRRNNVSDSSPEAAEIKKHLAGASQGFFAGQWVGGQWSILDKAPHQGW